MDNRFLQWLVGGLAAITGLAFISGTIQHQNINGLTITACTTLIATLVGATLIKKDPPKDDDQ